MCLSNVTTETPLVAQEDIVCYKWVELDKNTNNIHTPFQYHIISIGGRYVSHLEEAIADIVNIGLHSFKLKRNCKKIIKEYSILYWEDLIVKCTIPKGSEYYEGEFGGFKAYASNCIIYNEIVN